VTTTDDEGMPYNNNKWHRIVANRTGTKGWIRLDEKWTGQFSTFNFFHSN